jgi:hypothetical protein
MRCLPTMVSQRSLKITAIDYNFLRALLDGQHRKGSIDRESLLLQNMMSSRSDACAML